MGTVKGRSGLGLDGSAFIWRPFALYSPVGEGRGLEKAGMSQ